MAHVCLSYQHTNTQPLWSYSGVNFGLKPAWVWWQLRSVCYSCLMIMISLMIGWGWTDKQQFLFSLLKKKDKKKEILFIWRSVFKIICVYYCFLLIVLPWYTHICSPWLLSESVCGCLIQQVSGQFITVTTHSTSIFTEISYYNNNPI